LSVDTYSSALGTKLNGRQQNPPFNGVSNLIYDVLSLLLFRTRNALIFLLSFSSIMEHHSCSDGGVLHLMLLVFWTLSIFGYSEPESSVPGAGFSNPKSAHPWGFTLYNGSN
jgi:hypothetical protein